MGGADADGLAVEKADVATRRIDCIGLDRPCIALATIVVDLVDRVQVGLRRIEHQMRRVGRSHRLQCTQGPGVGRHTEYRDAARGRGISGGRSATGGVGRKCARIGEVRPRCGGWSHAMPTCGSVAQASSGRLAIMSCSSRR